jgi:predicted dienelactone hydrolase
VRRDILARVRAIAFAVLAIIAPVHAAEPPYPVGLKQIEFADGDRRIALAMFYPAALSDSSAKPAGLPFFTNLHLYRDAGLAEGRHPLVMLSHGRGSNPLQYAWFAETLASQGYIVAGLYHYRANTYDQSIAYLSNKIWQRPRDISSAMDFLLKDPVWGKAIDAERIGVAGHSQGGFTSLWIGGAKVNADKFLAFQQGWKNNQQVPAYLREELPPSIPRPPSTCAIRASRPPSPWRPASSRRSAWTRRVSVR